MVQASVGMIYLKSGKLLRICFDEDGCRVLIPGVCLENGDVEVYDDELNGLGGMPEVENSRSDAGVS